MARPERHVRVGAIEFSPERLDTGFYARAYFDIREAIRDSGLKTESIGSVCEPWQFGAYALCNHIEWSDAASGIPYLKAEALGSPIMNESGLAYVTPATHRLLEKSQLKPGDIVVSTSGTIGLCAVLPERLGEANSNQDTIKFNPSSAGYDCHFVAAWIASAPCQVFLNREAGGAVQQHVYLYNFKRLPLLKIAAEAQRYIGDKVRQAERLRERALKLERLATSLAGLLFERLIGDQEVLAALQCKAHDELQGITARATARPSLSSIDAHRETKHSNRIAPEALTTLWTASSYRPEITAALAHLRSSKWQPLGALCRTPIAQGRTPTYATDGRGYPCLKTRHVSGLFVDDSEPDLITFECATQLARFSVASGTILMNRSGAGSVGRCAVYLGDNAPLTNEHLLHIRVIPAHDPCFVTLFLSSWWGERAIEQGITGSTGQLNLANEHVSQIPVPVVNPEIQTGLGNLVRKQAACASHARALVRAAKLLVEHLIDGRLKEGDLIAAQKALEAGNQSADRELLKSLRQSDVPNAKPLIADVDALFSLLDTQEGEDA